MNLNQVTLPSLDITESIRFYRLLGFRLIVEALPHYARFECLDGDATFSVHLVNTLPVGDGIIVYFESNDLNKTVADLQNKGVVFDSFPTDQPWLWREARLRDPFNNLIILYTAGTNRKNPPWRVRNVDK